MAVKWEHLEAAMVVIHPDPERRAKALIQPAHDEILIAGPDPHDDDTIAVECDPDVEYPDELLMLAGMPGVWWDEERECWVVVA